MTPPPVDEHQRVAADEARGFRQLRRTIENTEKYVNACHEIGSQLKVPVVDIWTPFLRHAGWVEGEPPPGTRDIAANKVFQSLFSDGEYFKTTLSFLPILVRSELISIGLHPTPVGYRLVFEEVIKCIKEQYPSIDPDKLEPRFAPWETAPKWQQGEE